MDRTGAYLAVTLAVCASIAVTGSTEIHIPGPNGNLQLEDFLCPESGTLTPNTALVVHENQNVSSGEFCNVQNTTNITISGTGQVVVYCSNTTIGRRGFGFFNVSHLHITSYISFTDCGGVITSTAVQFVNTTSNFYYYTPNLKAALFFSHCPDLFISNVKMSYSHGFGFLGVNLCGSVLITNMELRHSVSDLSEDGCQNDFSSAALGIFIYYTDSQISEVCKTATNTLKVFLSCSDHKNLCSFYIPPVDRNHVPISSGSTLRLAYVQSEFKVESVFNLKAFFNSDILASTWLHFWGLDTNSSVTLSGSYHDNVQGSQIIVHFNPRLGEAKAPHIYPVSFRNLSFTKNDIASTSLASVRIKNAYYNFILQQPTITFKDVYCKNNTLPYILSALSSIGIAYSLKIEMENVIISQNNQRDTAFVSGSTNATLYFTNMNVLISGDSLISADFFGSCIQATSSHIYLRGNVTLANGRAFYGGGVSLSQSSYLHLVEPVHIVFENTSARVGGSIYTLQPYSSYSKFCTLQLHTIKSYNFTNIGQLEIFVDFSTNQTAYSISDSLFSFECMVYMNTQHCISTENVFLSTVFNEHIFSFESEFDSKLSFTNGLCYSFTVPPIASDMDCTWLDHGICDGGANSVLGAIKTFPGRTFLALQYGYDTDYHIVDKKGIWILNQDTVQFEADGASRLANVFSISLLNSSTVPSMELFVSLMQYPVYLSSAVYIASVEVLDCPPGFSLFERDSSNCECVKLLSERNSSCDINTGLVTIPFGSWAGYSNNINRTYFSYTCPNTRCSTSVQVDLSIPDYSCISNHSGNICGQCAAGFSVMFGSDECRICSNAWVLTIVLYALAGIVFVFLLFSLNLTVSSGTICGLVIYSNILSLTADDLLRDLDGISPLPLRIFIAMMNLDLGFPLCFYDGMTSGVKFGLQFVFPIYLWIIVIGLIVACRFSSRLANKLGFACVPVLATLLFFSYAKILSTVYAIFTFQTLSHQSRGSVDIVDQSVWLQDGQSYAEGSHVALIFFSLVLTVLFLLPFTVLLTFAFVLVRFRLVNKFYPLIDAFSGPFEVRYRFWFGVRLWVIVLLFFLFTVLRMYDSTAVFFSHSIVVTGLIVIQLLLKPFKDRVCGALDIYYLLNYLLIAISATYLSRVDQLRTRTIATTVLVSCAFVVFIGILLYQLYQVTKKSDWKCKITEKFKKTFNIKEDEMTKILEDSVDSRASIQKPVTVTYINYEPGRLRDSILETMDDS